MCDKMEKEIYHSTRNRQLTATASRAVLEGLAGDGGLYISDAPAGTAFDWRALLGRSTLEMAEAILSALLPDLTDMGALVRQGYAGKFESDELTPLRAVGDRYVLELFRGPTSAFKDVALSLLPRFITAARQVQGVEDEIVILTATSGDTGKAALEGFRDVPGTKIIVFYPEGGVSPVQQMQMTTQEGNNVCVCAVRGNFDDAQTGVKQVFSACRERTLPGVRLSSANSINIGRLAPQVVYYFKVYAELVKCGRISAGEPVHFVVPTGNFGDILAGYYAKLLGLPVGKLVCASNRNDVLTEFLTTGVYDRRRPFYKTTSPSMDILVSSNLERMLYLASGGDDAYVADLMGQLKDNGRYQVSAEVLQKLQETFDRGCCDDDTAARAIDRVWRQYGYVCDPHTAVAWHVSDEFMARQQDGAPVVVLSTASPYKFPVAVLAAMGEATDGDGFALMERLNALTGVPIPKNLDGLRSKKVRHTDVIDKGDMLRYVLDKIAQPVWSK